ncbi:MAG: hypothetical protein R3C59_00940 [Planctomycetaceae bacterium]
MNTSSFLNRLRRLFSRRKMTVQQLERHLRLMPLEDRRVLNASLALGGPIVLADGTGLTIADGGMGNVGGADVQTIELTLTTGDWGTELSGIDDTLYDIDGSVLTIDAALFENGGDALMAGNVLAIQGDAATNSLVLDLSGLDFVPTGGITFTGGEGPGDNDQLTIIYSAEADPAMNPLNVADGVADVTVNHTGLESGNVVLSGIGTISFDEIEPLALAGTAADLVINLPAGADATVVLSDDGTVNDNVSQIDGLFELTTFTNPTSSLTINDGTGVKSIDVQGLDAMFAADLSILEDDAAPDNAVVFSAATETGGGDLTVEADTITGAGDITTSAAADSGLASGTATLNAGTGINYTGTITTAGADHSTAGATASAAGLVTIATTDGPIAVAAIDASGGNATGGGGSTGGAAANVNITAADAGNDATHDITTNGTIDTSGGTGDTAGTAANVTLLADHDVNVDSTILTGGGIATINATNGNANINQAVTTLGGNVNIDAAAGNVTSMNTGDIITTGAAANVDSGDVTITAANIVDLDGTVDASGFNNTLAGNTDNSNGGNVSITANGGTLAVIDVVTSGGSVAEPGATGGNAGMLDLITGGAGITLGGTLNAAGGAATTFGDGETIDLAAPVILVGNVTITTSGDTAGNVIFQNTVQGPGNLTVNAQDTDNVTPSGDITFMAAVGNTTPVGNIVIQDADDVLMSSTVAASSLTQIAGTGNTTFSGNITIDPGVPTAIHNAVSVTTAGQINVNANISAEDADSDLTSASGEVISLTADTVNIAAGSIISTAFAAPVASTTYTATGDSVQITATTAVNMGAGATIVTDAGLANTFEITLPAGLLTQLFNNLVDPDNADFFLNSYSLTAGAVGEVNLQVHVDWRDPVNEGAAIVDPMTFANPLTSDRYQTFTIGTGGIVQTIAHTYSNLGDMLAFSLAGQGQFFGDLSVSHHDSIQVGVVSGLPDTPLTSTDDPTTGTFNPLATANIPPANTNFTAVGSTDEALDNLDLGFETGLFRVVVISSPPFMPPPQVPPPDPPAAPIPAPPVAPAPFLTVYPVEPPDVPLTSYSSQSEDYFQLRRTQTNEPVEGYEHIDDDIGWKLLQPKVLKKWIQGEKNLNGAGYELWLITTKGKNGQDVTFERPVLKFDIFDQQPFPMEEDLGDELPTLRLERLDVDEDGNIINGAPENDGEEADAPAAEQNSDDTDQASLPPVPDVAPIRRIDDANDGLARSAIAGLAVSATIAKARRQPGSSPQASTVARLLQRINGQG